MWRERNTDVRQRAEWVAFCETIANLSLSVPISCLENCFVEYTGFACNAPNPLKSVRFIDIYGSEIVGHKPSCIFALIYKSRILTLECLTWDVIEIPYIANLIQRWYRGFVRYARTNELTRASQLLCFYFR